MAEVYPITNKSDVVSIRRILNKWGDVKFAEAFYMGCHMGLRASDLLALRFDQIHGKRFVINDQKTGKSNEILITDVIRKSVDILAKYYKDNHPFVNAVYLFQSTSNNSKRLCKPLTVDALRKKIKEACHGLGLDDNFGSHTLRKTTGYHMYQDTGDIYLVQKLLNHKSHHETLAYIGVQRKQLDEAKTNLRYE